MTNDTNTEHGLIVSRRTLLWNAMSVKCQNVEK